MLTGHPAPHYMDIAPAMMRDLVAGGGGKGSTHLFAFCTPHIGRRTGSFVSRLTLHRSSEEKRVRPFENDTNFGALMLQSSAGVDASELRRC